ncbi:hypothetical protein A2852_00770 [Candidatus Adlerbacteria bacterium RIFCSPHIGHO2_01_FULL_54_23]|uniref:DUF2914 domain-containing protein n=3 Tax=Candidatus Adleribacteriota TaxID=1752736 RepID=A0A1F4Y055_9BACT|nr:MAG: hypothetical protein UY83_C0003G0103 [Candidatus Adlerbacteria bacterium GW2011_GWA1_54_10]KKW36299.1 MAG: hypothetical protein UY84_C0001G0187 [Candidatus Adlerbacteria bacterium GW2011_GWA2_54_12]KKW37829.1 MAG: hypothetical protein UY86_C0003G0051 [Candidatus Adlerbacteria bacterium GW2011_GWB1_54_7]OGC78860.1 MAG: hypothetical protein A2852_00770 [Candidatus Adlerbacteria bacterium RIFCSPHIGHO2_01_FULL_54_23]OGC87238.1 MAG: hypothetical protein A3B33_02695 [Candidatus Adlerbacteria 
MVNVWVALWGRYERHISAAGLLVGFLLDIVIADRPDSIPNNLLLLFYLLAAGFLIIILNRREMRRLEAQHSAEPLFLLFALQVFFGGLASNLLVLYGRSGTLAGSALFLGALAAMLVGNEFLKTRYAQLRFNVAVFYFLLLSYCIIAVPTFFTHTVGIGTFLLSGLASLAIIGLFLALMHFFVFRRNSTRSASAAYVVGTVFVVFNLLYFLNIIPPVPLSLRESGIYHSLLRRADGAYVALYEAPRWSEFWRSTSGFYTLAEGKSAFCYSSVFAPADLMTPIYHRWEYMTGSKWDTRSLVSFPISGGRAEGYRGFSVKSNLEPGRWRCNVETAQGALIGRAGFTVVENVAPELSQTVL